MARRQKPTTTATNSRSMNDVAPPSLPQPDRQNTNGRHGTIAARAHALYEERGYRHGYDLQDWFDAEREMLTQAPLS
ncbi:MAG: hypothetical protein Nkreftii_003053 [Candidatus Nitrospira kreftii]|uniref:DUF2934 domain-containing protein n=1 Tax=Candidatus Nitrospira kreftii TaxID=2652173 RepID=A0A7S8J0N3_9BACT|nr:MAG: hypothetical protein Nkreftii_003053 [Candidatus Nitrospira kreftii]